MSSISQAIQDSAKRYGLDPMVVAAVVLTESGGDPGAFRYESNFERRYINKKDHAALGGNWPVKPYEILFEENMRSSSHGLMQLMGQTAIEMGFLGKWPELYDVATNIHFGCKVLYAYGAAVQREHPEENDPARLLHLTLLKYNGGGNPDYPKKVLRFIDIGEAAKLLD